MKHIASAMNLLGIVRGLTDSIGVAVSFGKDSLATLDLCVRIFRRVEGYYLFRVRGLRIVDDWAENVRKRHGVTVRMYPHWDLSRCYRNAVLQPHYKGIERTPKIKWTQMEDHFRADVGVDWIAYGWRRNDSMTRAIIMQQCGGINFDARRVFPLRAWRRQDVYDYIASRSIPLPDGLGRKDQGGLDFHAGALSRLRDDYPDDWAKWQRDFPLSPVQLVRQCRAADSPENPLAEGGAGE